MRQKPAVFKMFSSEAMNLNPFSPNFRILTKTGCSGKLENIFARLPKIVLPDGTPAGTKYSAATKKKLIDFRN
jgi:hypothetical protein